MPRVHVTSEIGALRSVLVHTPGKELVAVTPGTREDYLYDDIIDLESAQHEHRRLVAVLERFAEVHEVRDALAEVAGRPEVREFLTTRALGRAREPARGAVLRRLRGAHGRRRARGRRPDRARTERSGLRAAAAPQPVLHTRRGHRDRRARDHRLDAPRRALDGRAADQSA